MGEQAATVCVEIPGTSYDAIVGAGLLTELGRLMAERIGPRRAMLIFDEGLPGEYVVEASRSLAHHGFQVSSASVRAQETSWRRRSDCWSRLRSRATSGATRWWRWAAA